LRARAILIPDGISRNRIRPAKIEQQARLVSAAGVTGKGKLNGGGTRLVRTGL
jgi:hypothetical protein